MLLRKRGAAPSGEKAATAAARPSAQSGVVDDDEDGGQPAPRSFVMRASPDNTASPGNTEKAVRGRADGARRAKAGPDVSPPSRRDPTGSNPADPGEPVVRGPVMAVTGALIALAVGLGVTSVVLAEPVVEVEDSVLARIDGLEAEIRTARSRTEGLPDVVATERALIAAHDAAAGVAEIQNGYRYLTPLVVEVAEADAEAEAGDPAAELASILQQVQRGLVPYFEDGGDPEVAAGLGPWYLLAADADADPGVGTPQDFRSGFEWQALFPSTIGANAAVPVTWVAVQTRTAEDTPPAVLAWARADYDLRHETFTLTATGVTTYGETVRQEVE